MKMTSFRDPLLLLVLCAVVFWNIGDAAPPTMGHQKCQRIQHEMCNDLPYNMTSFPNLVGEDNINDASESISTYKPLLSVVCSEQLRFFLCSVYFPMCNEKLAQPIGPCRPLCLSVKEKCLPILEGFGFHWPDVIRCDKFPLENNREKMCMKGPNEQGTIQDERHRYLESNSEMNDDDDDVINPAQRRQHNDRSKCAIDQVFINKSAKCVPLCTGSQNIAQVEQEASTRLLMILASSSIILTLLSLFIVFISRFQILTSITALSMFFSSCSFTICALIYIFSVSYREHISCTDYTHHLLFVVDGLNHVPCSSVASLIYYFSTCGRLWWLMLCFTWNKTAQFSSFLQEGRTRIQMMIWGVPLAPLMLALLAKSISANPLTGICLVGAATHTTDWMFNFFRELLFSIIASVGLLSACCRLLGSGSSESDPNPFAGIIAIMYPITALFYILSFLNDATQPSIGWSKTFNVVSAIKYTFDLLLSIVICSLCFIYFLSRSTRSGTSKISKEGYQPAVPKLPQPAIPGSVRSNTYASTFRTNMI